MLLALEKNGYLFRREGLVSCGDEIENGKTNRRSSEPYSVDHVFKFFLHNFNDRSNTSRPQLIMCMDSLYKKEE